MNYRRVNQNVGKRGKLALAPSLLPACKAFPGLYTPAGVAPAALGELAALRRNLAAHLGRLALSMQPGPSPHHGQVQSTYQGAQISAVTFRPHAEAQITETVGMNPDPPAQRQSSPDVAQSVPYVGSRRPATTPTRAGSSNAGLLAQRVR